MNSEALAPLAVGEPEQFTFTGANGDTVYGYVMKPAKFDARKRYPVAFFVHGGPQVSLGMPGAIAGIRRLTRARATHRRHRLHGSPGYGQAFTDSISGDWGGKPLEDLQKGCAAALEKYPVARQRAHVRVGCVLRRLHDELDRRQLVRAVQMSREPRRHLRQPRAWRYSTEELWFERVGARRSACASPETYEKFNPVNHVAKWSKPMLVIHGTQDYRVPDTQGISTFTALQRRGIPSRLLVFPNENHWVLKPNNSVQWHREVQRWLDQWTKGTE